MTIHNVRLEAKMVAKETCFEHMVPSWWCPFRKLWKFWEVGTGWMEWVAGVWVIVILSGDPLPDCFLVH